MQRLFLRPIRAVRLRQRIQRMLNCGSWGLLLAALVVLVSPILAGTILFMSILLGLCWTGKSIAATARLIDRHYHLQDRMLTSIALLRHQNPTPMEQLQMDDTAKHLSIVKPQAVCPLRLPKMLWCVIALLAVDLAVMHGNFFVSAKSSEPVIQLLPVEDVALLKEIVNKTEELIQEHACEPSLQKLSEQLEKLWSKFDMTGRDIKESLATLSEMEDAFQKAIDALQTETMEESLSELAKTFELSAKTLPISKFLEKGDYSEAASELKQLDAEMLNSLSEAERKAMTEEMQALADKAEQRNQKGLQEAAQKMSDALQNSDDEQYHSAADELANEVEKHGIRQKISMNLAMQQMELGMMKADNGPGNMSGGKGTEKTEQASQTWGSGAAGNPNEGKETDLQGERQLETLTGTLGEQGDSIAQTLDSQEMTSAKSLLEYRERYQEYKRLSEAVLDAEPIPLGQRQVIRRYFEAIRPSD